MTPSFIIQLLAPARLLTTVRLSTATLVVPTLFAMTLVEYKVSYGCLKPINTSQVQGYRLIARAHATTQLLHV